MLKVLREKRYKLDNRGAGIPMMLVAVGLATLLVSVLMMVSLFNFQMKKTEVKAKDNFYSAEAIFDQIQTGLRYESSQAASAAYKTAVETYGITRGVDNAAAEKTRIVNFQSEYLTSLQTAMRDGKASVGKYYIGGVYQADSPEVDEYDAEGTEPSLLFESGLAKYVDSEVAEMIVDYQKNTDGKPKVRITYNKGENALEGTVEVNANGLILKGITVELLDENGYYTCITSDIVIGYPDISLKEASIAPNAVYYTVIAENGVLVSSGMKPSVDGEVFAGDHTANANDTAEADDLYMEAGSGLELKQGSELIVNMGASATKPDHFIVQGNTRIDNLAYLYLHGGQFWTDNINLYESSKLRTDYNSISFVADDLTTCKNGAEVTLEGSYYGYAGGNYTKTNPKILGDDKELIGAENSSAIIINGKNTKISLLMDTLQLYGSAYLTQDSFAYTVNNGGTEAVNTNYVAPAVGESQNILLGSSLSVKTDQIAFLAPVECLALNDGSGKNVAHNPMTDEEYKEWSVNGTTSKPGSLNVEAAVEALGGQSIKAVLLNGLPEGSAVEAVGTTTVWRHIGTGANEKLVAYVYLDFQSELAASKYLKVYADASRDTLAKYASVYNNTVSIGLGVGEISTAGAIQYNVKKKENYSTFQVEAGDSNLITDSTLTQDSYWNRYQALQSMLVSNVDSLSTGQLQTTVFYNVINKSAISGAQIYDVNGKYGIVTDQDVTITNSGISYGAMDKASLDDTRFVLTTGNVYMDADEYHGTIITEGTLYIRQNSKIVCNDTENSDVEIILRYEPSDGTKSLIETYFLNGANYLFSGDSSSEEKGLYVDFNELVTYSNWSKE